MDTAQSTLNELKIQIHAELDLLNPLQNPWIVSQMQNVKGYADLEEKILTQVLAGATIDEAIIELEQLNGINQAD